MRASLPYDARTGGELVLKFMAIGQHSPKHSVLTSTKSKTAKSGDTSLSASHATKPHHTTTTVIYVPEMFDSLSARTAVNVLVSPLKF